MFFSNTNRTNLTNCSGYDPVCIRGIREIRGQLNIIHTLIFFSNTNRTNLTNCLGYDPVYLWDSGDSWSRTSRKRSHLQIRLESLCIGKERSKKSVLKTPCASVISVSFFDLRSVAEGSQNDLLQVEFRI